MFDKPLPNCENTERATIGETLLDGTIQGSLLSVATTDFYNRDYQKVWAAICELHEEQQVFTHLEVWQRVKDIAGFSLKMSDLLGMTQGIPPGFSQGHSVQYLRELAVIRQALRNLAKLQEKIFDKAGIPEIATQLDAIQQQLLSVKSEKSNFQSFAEVLTQEVYPRIDQFTRGESNRIRTGFDLIDEATLDGIGSSELWIIAALTSEGKSAFALQVARQITERGIPVACISREMLNYENGFRALSQFGQFNNGVFRSGMMPQTAEQIKKVGEYLEPLPLYFDDKTNNVKQLKQNVSILIDKVGIKVLFIDYLQLLQSNSRENRQGKIEEIVNDLKDFAMQKEIGIVLLSQFNREADKLETLPKISNLDGASAIEKAGNVILLWKLEQEIETDVISNKEFRRGALKIAKGRHTAKSEFVVKFYGSETRFEVV